jgi:hypothetical protein
VERETIIMEGKLDPGGLAYGGAILTTEITITEAHREALEKAGLPIPPPVRCRFLLDTGAHRSVVKHEVAERAGLKLIAENTPLHGVGVDTTGRTYIGRVVFSCPSRVVDTVRHTITVDTQVMGAKLDTDRFEGLIGRDVLQHFALTYDGHEGLIKLRYYRP